MGDLWFCLPDDARLPEAVAPAPVARFFRWRDDWCLGISAMDRDHQRLAMLLDHLAAGFGDYGPESPRGQAAQQPLLDQLAVLADETREHFAREEALMRTADYPDLGEHRAEHEIMRAELIELTREIAARGDCRLELDTLRALKAWFLGHLLDTDRRLAQHLIRAGLAHRH